jgi:di/tricarboxylate transporter
MLIQVLALLVLALVFVIGTWKPIHLGLLALTAAFGFGMLGAGESASEIMDAFPVSLLVLLVGVTYLFSIAREAGVIDVIIHRSIQLVRGNLALLPWIFFFLAFVLSCMGSPLACVALAPIAMSFVTKHKMDPVVMGLAVITGGSAGGFAPISIFGVLTNGIAENAGIETNPMFLFASAIGFNYAAMSVAYLMFGGPSLIRRHRTEGKTVDADGTPKISNGGPGETARDKQALAALLSSRSVSAASIGQQNVDLLDRHPEQSPSTVKLSLFQIMSMLSLLALFVLVITLSALDMSPDIGVISLALAMVITLAYPHHTKPAVKGIDWSTVLLVGGVITYAGVLQRSGVIDMLGDAAAQVPHPALAALIICLVGAFVSTFTSTTGILGALIPLSIPLMATGEFTGYGLVVALALSSSLVDSTPFATGGAAVVAGATAEEKPRLVKMMIRWGFSMIVIGPIATVSVLVLPSLL